MFLLLLLVGVVSTKNTPQHEDLTHLVSSCSQDGYYLHKDLTGTCHFCFCLNHVAKCDWTKTESCKRNNLVAISPLQPIIDSIIKKAWKNITKVLKSKQISIKSILSSKGGQKKNKDSQTRRIVSNDLEPNILSMKTLSRERKQNQLNLKNVQLSKIQEKYRITDKPRDWKIAISEQKNVRGSKKCTTTKFYLSELEPKKLLSVSRASMQTYTTGFTTPKLTQKIERNRTNSLTRNGYMDILNRQLNNNNQTSMSKSFDMNDSKLKTIYDDGRNKRYIIHLKRLGSSSNSIYLKKISLWKNRLYFNRTLLWPNKYSSLYLIDKVNPESVKRRPKRHASASTAPEFGTGSQNNGHQNDTNKAIDKDASKLVASLSFQPEKITEDFRNIAIYKTLSKMTDLPDLKSTTTLTQVKEDLRVQNNTGSSDITFYTVNNFDPNIEHNYTETSRYQKIEEYDVTAQKTTAYDARTQKMPAYDASTRKTVAYDAAIQETISYDATTQNTAEYDATSETTVTYKPTTQNMVAYDFTSQKTTAYNVKTRNAAEYDTTTQKMVAYDATPQKTVAYDANRNSAANDATTHKSTAYDATNRNIANGRNNQQTVAYEVKTQKAIEYQKMVAYDATTQKTATYNGTTQKTAAYYATNQKTEAYDETNQNSAAYGAPTQKTAYYATTQKTAPYNGTTQKTVAYDKKTQKLPAYDVTNQNTAAYDIINHKTAANDAKTQNVAEYDVTTQKTTAYDAITQETVAYDVTTQKTATYNGTTQKTAAYYETTQKTRKTIAYDAATHESISYVPTTQNIAKYDAITQKPPAYDATSQSKPNSAVYGTTTQETAEYYATTLNTTTQKAAYDDTNATQVKVKKRFRSDVTTQVMAVYYAITQKTVVYDASTKITAADDATTQKTAAYDVETQKMAKHDAKVQIMASYDNKTATQSKVKTFNNLKNKSMKRLRSDVTAQMSVAYDSRTQKTLADDTRTQKTVLYDEEIQKMQEYDTTTHRKATYDAKTQNTIAYYATTQKTSSYDAIAATQVKVMKDSQPKYNTGPNNIKFYPVKNFARNEQRNYTQINSLNIKTLMNLKNKTMERLHNNAIARKVTAFYAITQKATAYDGTSNYMKAHDGTDQNTAVYDSIARKTTVYDTTSQNTVVNDSTNQAAYDSIWTKTAEAYVTQKLFNTFTETEPSLLGIIPFKSTKAKDYSLTILNYSRNKRISGKNNVKNAKTDTYLNNNEIYNLSRYKLKKNASKDSSKKYFKNRPIVTNKFNFYEKYYGDTDNKLKEQEQTNSLLAVSKNGFKIIKFLKKMLRRQKYASLRNTNTFAMFDQRTIIDTLCDHFGPCEINAYATEKVRKEVAELIKYSIEMFKSINDISHLLNNIELPMNGKELKKSNKTSFQRSVTKLRTIMKDYSMLKETGNDTQKKQIETIKTIVDLFIHRTVKFAKTLDEITNLIKKNDNEMERSIQQTKLKDSQEEEYYKMRDLLKNYDLVHHTFLKRMYKILSHFDTSSPRTISKSYYINSFKSKHHNKTLIKNRRRLKGNPKRFKRDLDDDSFNYLFLMVKYMKMMMEKQAHLESKGQDGIIQLMKATNLKPRLKQIEPMKHVIKKLSTNNDENRKIKGIQPKINHIINNSKNKSVLKDVRQKSAEILIDSLYNKRLTDLIENDKFVKLENIIYESKERNEPCEPVKEHKIKEVVKDKPSYLYKNENDEKWNTSKSTDLKRNEIKRDEDVPGVTKILVNDEYIIATKLDETEQRYLKRSSRQKPKFLQKRRRSRNFKGPYLPHAKGVSS